MQIIVTIIMRKRMFPITLIISLSIGLISFQTYAEPTLSDIKQMAAQGKSTAQYHLGMMYLSGEQGVTKDTTQALKWLTLADQNGSVGAKYSLGLMYMTGTGYLKINPLHLNGSVKLQSLDMLKHNIPSDACTVKV